MNANYAFEIEIQIVDHCNLNCDNCNHFSNLAEPWFMSLEEFEFSLKRIREEFYPHGLERLMILGGEPLLHPQIKEFCDIARKTFPEKDFNIDILTNGIKLNTMSNEDLNYLVQRACFCVTPYPKVSYSDHTKKLMNGGYVGNLASRLFFVSTNIDLEPTETASYNYSKCPKYKLPCYFVKNYKVYICPFSGCAHILNEKFGTNIQIQEGDYVDLRTGTYEDLKKLQEKGPAHICAYCNSKCFPIYWSNGSKRELSHYTGISPVDLYVDNYEEYDKLFNGSSIFTTFKNENYSDTKKKLIDLIDGDYCGTKTALELNRIKGKIDIIIPFYNINENMCIDLFETLKRQSFIDKCHIYLISDCSPYERVMFNVFDNKGLNITFLKTSQRMGPGGARQIGINNSFNPYLFFLDSDDSLINTDGLKDMYEIIEQKNADIVSGITGRIDWHPEGKHSEIVELMWMPGQTSTQDSHCLLYKREFLQNNNIHFKNTFIAEDADFLHQVMKYQPKVEPYLELTYLYKRNMPTSIGVETSLLDKLLCRITINLKNADYKSLNERWADILYADDLIARYDTLRPEDIETVIGITFYFAMKFFDRLSAAEQKSLTLKDKDDFTYILHEKILNQDYGFKLHGKIYTNVNQYKEFVLKAIDNSVIKNSLLKELEEWI